MQSINSMTILRPVLGALAEPDPLVMMEHHFKEGKTLITRSGHFTHFEGCGNYGADYGMSHLCQAEGEVAPLHGFGGSLKSQHELLNQAVCMLLLADIAQQRLHYGLPHTHKVSTEETVKRCYL